MLKVYLKTFFRYVFAIAFYTAFVGIFFWNLPVVFVILIILGFIITGYLTCKDLLVEEVKRTKQLENEVEIRKREEELWKKTLIERASGFPSLLKLIGEYSKKNDESIEKLLLYKKHPAYKAAEIVKEEGRRRRQAEMEYKKISALIEYYESIAPFLIDLKGDYVGVQENVVFEEYSEEEKLDPAIQYLAKEEFRKLPTVERNQIALDRFWERSKSKWLIGRIYERYVGYLYESRGYEVEYVGIIRGFDDLGRDLICSKGDELIVIQCKHWSKFSTIYEKHIFQFFGTVFQYRDSIKNKNVKAIFYTSTSLSEVARRFAKELNIELFENFKMDSEYPSIKCNISNSTKEKIYHLPFDQQYDKVKITPSTGEFYCTTVAEAENAGFRRAFRWQGSIK